MKPLIFDIEKEPTQEQYLAILDFCSSRASKIQLVVREPHELGPRGKEILNDLSRSGAEIRDCNEWAGTKLLAGTACVYLFHVDDHSVSALKNCTDSLFSWVEPDLPEDLSFLGSNGEPIFVSISHERDAYFVLTADERSELEASVAGLKLRPHVYEVGRDQT